MTLYSNFAALDGDVVTEGHRKYCATTGHSSRIYDGVRDIHCPRCGDEAWKFCASCFGPIDIEGPDVCEFCEPTGVDTSGPRPLRPSDEPDEDGYVEYIPAEDHELRFSEPAELTDQERAEAAHDAAEYQRGDYLAPEDQPEPPVRILMAYADMNEQSYGIAFRSAADHRIKGARHNPGSLFTVTVWLNVFRHNPHPDKAVWKGVGMIGGPGKYLGPDNKGTDAPYSVTTSAQASVISAYPIGRNPVGEELAVGRSVVLVLPNRTELGPFVIAQGSLADPHMEEVS